MAIIRDQWKPYAISSQDAQIAKELGLRADSLEEDEKQLFPFLLQTTTANKYLSGRNFLIKEWHLNYSNSIMSFSAVADLKLTTTLDAYLLQKAYQFLDRYRYINYGLLQAYRGLRVDNITVIVVGAGLSGLTAAREIYNIFQTQDIMPRIIIFEARQRIGGRLFSFPLHCRWTEETNPCIDLGPTYISDHRCNRHLLSQMGLEGLEQVEFDYEKIKLFDLDGTIVDKDRFAGARNFLDTLVHDIKIPQSDPIDKTSIVDRLEDAVLDHELYSQFHDSHLRIIHWHLAALQCLSESNFKGLFKHLSCKKNITLPGGLGQISHGLAYGTDSDKHNSLEIHCGRRIDSINTTESGKIEVKSGESGFFGDFAVLAVPLTAIKGNTVEDGEDYKGIVNKICLVFPRVFWPIDIEIFGVLGGTKPETRGKYFSIRNMYKETRLPCLMIYCCGASAIDIESLDDVTIQKDILAILARMFPLECPLPYPIESVVTRWSSDEYTYQSTGKDQEASRGLVVNESHKNCKLVWACDEYSLGLDEAIKNGKTAARIIADQILGLIS